MEKRFNEVLVYLFEQRWFYHLELYDEYDVLEDAIYDTLEVNTIQERMLFAKSLLKFALAVRHSLDQYLIRLETVQRYLVKSSVLGERDYQSIFFESIPRVYLIAVEPGG